MNFLITGAGRGLGLEYTKQLLEKKKSVLAWVRNPDGAKELQSLKEKYPQTLQIQKVDLTRQEDIRSAAKQINTPIDVVINNAGVLTDKSDSFETLSIKTMEDTFAVNVWAPMVVAQSLLPILQKSASPLLVNMSSKMGSIADNGSGGYYAYRMSKTALNMFTKSFSADYPQIKTLCLHPGWAQTDMGGPQATVSPKDSVAGLLRIILEPQKYETGSFVNYTGSSIPW